MKFLSFEPLWGGDNKVCMYVCMYVLLPGSQTEGVDRERSACADDHKSACPLWTFTCYVGQGFKSVLNLFTIRIRP